MSEPPRPLLLLPGTLCNWRLFEPLRKELGDGYPAVVGDMTGARSAPELAARILRSAPPTFSLLGFSLGGIVAMEMIAQAPYRVTRLALVSTTPRPDPAANADVRRDAVARAARLGLDSYTQENWPLFTGPESQADASLKALIMLMAREVGIEAMAEQAEVAINRTDSRPRLAGVRVPTLVLAGRHERICPLEAHREIADAVPGSRFVTVDAGHFAPLEQPVAVGRHVRAWLGI